MKSLTTLSIAFAIFSLPVIALADESLEERCREAATIIETINLGENPIPQSILDKAKGVAIVKVVRGGFIVGGQHGNGVVLKNNGGHWSAPAAFDMGGGSFGAQIGGDVVSYVFVLNNDVALAQFTSLSKSKFDAGASAIAGPNRAAANKKDLPESSIYAYTTSDGAFAGATVGGSYINIQPEVNQAAYGPNATANTILTGKQAVPDYAKKLIDLLSGK